MLDAVYDNLDFMGTYYFDRSQEMRDAIQHLEVEAMAAAFKARGMVIDDGVNPVHGTIFDRLDRYAEESKGS
jgi:hypothetical protein